MAEIDPAKNRQETDALAGDRGTAPLPLDADPVKHLQELQALFGGLSGRLADSLEEDRQGGGQGTGRSAWGREFRSQFDEHTGAAGAVIGSAGQVLANLFGPADKEPASSAAGSPNLPIPLPVFVLNWPGAPGSALPSSPPTIPATLTSPAPPPAPLHAVPDSNVTIRASDLPPGEWGKGAYDPEAPSIPASTEWPASVPNNVTIRASDLPKGEWPADNATTHAANLPAGTWPADNATVRASDLPAGTWGAAGQEAEVAPSWPAPAPGLTSMPLQASPLPPHGLPEGSSPPLTAAALGPAETTSGTTSPGEGDGADDGNRKLADSFEDLTDEVRQLREEMIRSRREGGEQGKPGAAAPAGWSAKLSLGGGTKGGRERTAAPPTGLASVFEAARITRLSGGGA